MCVPSGHIHSSRTVRVARLPCEFLMLVTSCSFFRLVEDQKEADRANGPAFPREAHFAHGTHLHALHRPPHRRLPRVNFASLFPSSHTWTHTRGRTHTYTLTRTRTHYLLSSCRHRLHERSAFVFYFQLMVKPANRLRKMQISSRAKPMVITLGVSLS